MRERLDQFLFAPCASQSLVGRSKPPPDRGKSRELGVTSMRPCGWLRPEVFRSPGDKNGAKTHTARAHWRL